MKKILAVILTVLMALSLFSACAGQTGELDTLVIRSYGDPMSFEPNVTADDFAYDIVQNLYNRLVKLDASKSVIPDLAESWDVSSDGLAITFHLKQNAKWHDGKPVTSADVKYTYDTIKATPEYFLSPNLATVKSIEAPDEYTVVFNMETPDVPILGYLAWYASFVIPKHIFDNGQPWEDNPAGQDPIGSGPFKFVEHTPGVSTILEKNADYHDGEPKMDRLVFSIIPDDMTAVQALINGEIDVLEMFPDAELENLRRNDDIRLMLNEYPSPMYIAFNMDVAPCNDQAFRTAFAMAVDRQEICDKIYLGVREPEISMYPAVVKWAANLVDTVPEFDIAGARKVLEDAGYTLDSDGYFVRGVEIDIFEGYGFPETGKLLQATLKEAGIELVLLVQEFNAWNQKVFVDGDFIVEMQGGFQGPDPSALGSRVSTNGSMNQSSYSNAEVDALFLEAAKIGDQQQRADIFHQIQAILAVELPILPLVNYAAYEAHRSNLKNLPIDGAGKWGWQEYTFTEFVK